MKRLVVLDTNCLVQMLSVHRAAWQAFREGRYELCVTDDIVDEYEEMSARMPISGYWRRYISLK